MRPLIFITNDDGIEAKGLLELAQAVSAIGEVWVVAPNGPRSAQSSALTVESPIWAKPHKDSTDAITMIACSGTPADCVKLAVDQLLPRKPDILLSGINHGSNVSINVIYSGTMGAAMEGSLHDIPSVGFSLCSHKPDADFSLCLPFFTAIVQQVLETGLPNEVCLNVNAPVGEITGVRLCRQAHGRWANEYEKHLAPRPNDYYWLIGDFTTVDADADDTDQWAIDHHYISMVPIHTDMTHYQSMKKIASEFQSILK